MIIKALLTALTTVFAFDVGIPRVSTVTILILQFTVYKSCIGLCRALQSCFHRDSDAQFLKVVLIRFYSVKSVRCSSDLWLMHVKRAFYAASI